MIGVVRVLSLILAVAFASMSGAKPPSRDRSSGVGGTLAGLIQADDYPVEALDRNEQGTVGILIRVDDKGAVTDCVLEQSSGSAALDAQTCRLVWMRAKFQPARNARGKAIAGERHERVAWRIAEDMSPNEPWAIRTITDLVPGEPPACRVEFEGAMKNASFPQGGCPVQMPAMPKQFSEYPYVAAELILEQRFTIGKEPKVTMGVGDRLFRKQVAQLEVDAAGNLSSCKVLETIGEMPAKFAGLCGMVGRKYGNPNLPTAKIGPYTAYFLIAAYGHLAPATPEPSDSSRKP